MEFISQMLIAWNKFSYNLIAGIFSLFVIFISIYLVLVVYKFRAGFKSQKQGKHKEAIEHYDRVLRYSQSVPSGLNFVASILNLRLGIDTVTPVLNTLMFGDSEARQTSCNIYQYTQDTISDTNIVIATYNNRGNSKIELKDYKAAIDDYKKAINKGKKLKVNYASACNSRGIAKANLRHYKEAIVDYDQAVILDPNYTAAYDN